MSEKVLLKDKDGVIMLPVTRGELVLDSSGQVALRSAEFLATASSPGLTTINHVVVSKEDVPGSFSTEVPIVRLASSSEQFYPVTSADAVVVNTDKGPDSLTNVIKEIKVELNTSKIVLDERPTEGNTTHGVSSDGIFQELKETVGNIQILLQNL